MKLKTIQLITLVLFSQFALATSVPPASVFTEKAKPIDIFNVLTFPARVVSLVNAAVRTETDGAVIKIVKGLGTKVKRGETIAIVKHTDPVYNYAPHQVMASVNGVVSGINISAGSLVNKGEQIASITDPEKLMVVIEVAALDLNTVRSGLKGELAIPGIAEPVKVSVTGISPSIDPMIGTSTCELGVDTTDLKKVVAGQVGRVQFKVNPRQGYMLPESAIVYKGQDAFVRVINEGKVARIPVKLGEKRQGQVEVTEGITPGVEIVNRASRYVAEGEEVKVETTNE